MFRLHQLHYQRIHAHSKEMVTEYAVCNGHHIVRVIVFPHKCD
jgi:hypothetical protein